LRPGDSGVTCRPMPKRDPARSAGPSQRQLRVGEELRHALSAILARRDFRDPVLQSANVTVTEVRISPDLKNATVFIMPLAGEHSPETIAALHRGAAFIRGLVAKEVPLRYVPVLDFRLDTSFEHASRIDALLHRPDVARDLETPRDGADDGADT
jgi:ribosome-binding factor A